LPYKKSFYEKEKFKIRTLPVALTFQQVNNTSQKILTCSYGLAYPIPLIKAQVAELVDAQVSGTCGRKTVVELSSSLGKLSHWRFQEITAFSSVS